MEQFQDMWRALQGAAPRTAPTGAAARAHAASIRELLAPLLDRRATAGLSVAQFLSALQQLEDIWEQIGGAWVPPDVAEVLVRVVAQGSTEEGLLRPMRLAMALPICTKLMASPLAPSQQNQLIAAGLPGHLLSCIHRCTTPTGAVPQLRGGCVSGPGILSLVGHTLSVTLSWSWPPISSAEADAFIASSPGGAAKVVDTLLAAARSSPDGLLAMMKPLGDLAWVRPDCAVRIIADKPLLEAALASLRRRQRCVAIGEDEAMPALTFMMKLASRTQSDTAAAALRLPGLVSIPVAILEEARRPDRGGLSRGAAHSDQQVSMLLLQAILKSEGVLGSSDISEAAALAVASSANNAAMTWLLEHVSSAAEPTWAAMAANVVALVYTRSAACRLLQQRLGPRPLVAALFSVLGHPDLAGNKAVVMGSDSAGMDRLRTAAFLLRSVTACCKTPDDQRRVRAELSKQAMPAAAVPRLCSALTLENSDLEVSPEGTAFVLSCETLYVLMPVVRRCARGGKLRPLRDVPLQVAAILQLVMEPAAIAAHGAEYVIDLLGAAASFADEIEASGAPIPWGPEGVEKLLLVARRAERWLSTQGTRAGFEAKSAGAAGKLERLVARLQGDEEGGTGAGAAHTNSRAPAGAPAAAAAAGATVCGGCGAAAAPGGVALKRCRGCHSARYCSEACAKAAWPAHKRFCRAVQKAAAGVAAGGGSAGR